MCSSFICDFCLQNIKLYHFVRTILSIPLCPIPFCPYTILSIPFCPYHFVPYHFVRSPNDQKLTEKLAGPHNERRLPSKNYNRGKNGREKEKSKTKNDVTGVDAERGLQQVEGESWGSW